VLQDLRACPWPHDDFFGATTCNIGTISGGTRPNIIPAEAQAELQIRLVTESTRITEQLERLIGGRRANRISLNRRAGAASLRRKISRAKSCASPPTFPISRTGARRSCSAPARSSTRTPPASASAKMN
jgi:acetylornithine deacetylase/succinyl-diaminopimelate desuccinylase-like protein